MKSGALSQEKTPVPMSDVLQSIGVPPFRIENAVTLLGSRRPSLCSMLSGILWP